VRAALRCSALLCSALSRPIHSDSRGRQRGALARPHESRYQSIEAGANDSRSVVVRQRWQPERSLHSAEVPSAPRLVSPCAQLPRTVGSTQVVRHTTRNACSSSSSQSISPAGATTPSLQSPRRHLKRIDRLETNAVARATIGCPGGQSTL